MSILDFAENPEYSIIAVALSPTDAAVLLGVDRKRRNADATLRRLLIQAIEMLQAELDTINSGEVIPNNTPTRETPNETPTTARSAHQQAV